MSQKTMILRLIKKHTRLVIACVFGTLIGIVMPSSWDVLVRALVGWNVGVWSYILLMLWLMVHATPSKVAQLAEQEDEAALAIVVIMSLASVASLVAIVFELSMADQFTPLHKVWHYVITIATLVGSWCFVAMIFTFHYARIYYRSPVEHRALIFADTDLKPNYWDFLYFSFTIAVAFQTSDVALASRNSRKAALAQEILSFWFNITILGLSVNVAAGLVSR